MPLVRRAGVPGEYQNAVFELALGAAAIAAALAAGVLAWRYGRSVQRAQRQTREHAEVARMVGRRLPGAGPAVVLDAPQPAAYSAARCSGRPVLITALLAMATGAAVPVAALGAAACEVTARVQRLLQAPRPGRLAAYGAALLAVILVLALVPGLAAAFAGPLAAHGIAVR